MQLHWPFLSIEALAAGSIAERSMREHYEEMYPSVLMPKGATPSAMQRAEGAYLWTRRRGVLAGQSAAAVLGTKWVDGAEPAEVLSGNRKAPDLLIVRTERLNADDVVTVRGMRVTSQARTGFDVGRHTVNRLTAVKRMDALANATGLKVIDIEAVAAAHPRARGLPRLRRVLPLVDGGAESPQETVARLALIDAGLPRPRTQVRIVDDYGTFIARVDMAYEEQKIAVEYDGPQHWENAEIRQRDIDKMYTLAAMGWIVIRVSLNLLKYRRAAFIRRVAEALESRL